MSKFFKDYCTFTLKSITIMILFFGIGAGFSIFSSKMRENKDMGLLSVKNLTQHYYNTQAAMLNNIHIKGDEQAVSSNKQDIVKTEGRTFVIKFDGDIYAEGVDALKKEITAILSVATDKDAVVLILESSGGTVNGYGLAAFELARITARNIHLTVLIDEVAASGGYMMAAVADKIIAAPFAIIGSIGVRVEMPNFNELLEKRGVKYEEITSGEYKKTLSMLGKNTEKGRKKLQEDLDKMHAIFKAFVKSKRPDVNIEKISTGEVWVGSQAKELGLVDGIMTSADYLMSLYQKNKQVYLVSYEKPEPFLDKLIKTIGVSTSKVLSQSMQNTSSFSAAVAS